MRTWFIVVMLLGSAVARGQDPDESNTQRHSARAERMQALQEKAVRLIRATQDLGDWDEHYEYIRDATDRVFERYNWDSESDLFALEMVGEVGRIPPWRTFERFDKALELIGDRYLLDDGQIASLQSKIIQVNLELFTKHSDRIMEYGMEALETRSAGEPFTPEQVARWTTIAEPVFIDARKGLNATAKEFMSELDPEQRELVELDLAAANRRMGDMEKLSDDWKRGKWDPRDWGMENDPIQNRGARRGSGATAASDDSQVQQASEEQKPSPVKTVQPVPAKTDDDAWAKYVRAFIKKYNLNDEQQQRAWLFYHDSKARDDVFKRRFERQIKTIREKAAANSKRAQASIQERTEQRQLEVERLFGQLKRRLERLPTRAQRKNAEPDASPVQKTSSQPKP